MTQEEPIPPAAVESAAVGESAAEGGKRVSWVELYFDLIFVVAVSQTAHLIVARPSWGGVGIALGLFLPLWWTWIGFVVLYNRHSSDRPSRRLFVLAGTIPCAVAAVEVPGAERGQTAGFALALAGARLLLAVAYPASARRGNKVAERAGIGYGLSTVVFVVSAVVPAPWRYVLWAFALIQEAGFLMLGRDQPGERRDRRQTRMNRAEAMQVALAQPTDPDRRLDAPHLAERFGLFMIILLGEIVVSVGSAAVGGPQRTVAYWLGLVSGLVLAGALWWIYFDSAAHLNEYVLRASGGNPTFAYGIYAGGHLGPAFALVAIAAGVSMSLHADPPIAAPWLVSVGLAFYLVGTRAFLGTEGRRYGALARFLIMSATVLLALLHRVLIPAGVVAVLAVWAVGVAAVVSWQRPGLLRRIAQDPLSIFRTGTTRRDSAPGPRS